MTTTIPGLRGPILPPQGAVNILLVSLPLLIFSETNSSWIGHFTFKTLSSFAFLYGPLQLTTANTSVNWSNYDTLLTSGLIASLIGDVCLVPARSTYHKSAPKGDERKPTNAFKLGVLSFAGAHVAYMAAFLKHTTSISWPIFTSVFLGNMLFAKSLGVIYPAPSSTRLSGRGGFGNMLNLKVDGEMRPLVAGYAVIISGMLAAAASTEAPGAVWPLQRIVGAGMFVISDLFVAQDAFGVKDAEGKPQRWYRLAVGWGLYFWGQMVLAGSVH